VYLLELAGEDDALAVSEARSAAQDVESIGPGLATATHVAGTSGSATDPTATLDAHHLALTHRVSEQIAATTPSLEAARQVLETRGFERTGSVAVRARDVRATTGIDTPAVERALGALLVDAGFDIDLETPDHELRALFSRGVCALGWLALESERTFGERAPTDRAFFQPGSMDPILARTLVNIAGAGPENTVLDPMCGTGGVLIEAGLVGANPAGMDVQEKMVRGARENLSAALDTGFEVAKADATRLPVRDSAMDAVVFDAPYGRQSKIEGDGLGSLVSGALSEANRVADRAVVVGDRSWAAAAREQGWTVQERFDRRVHRSLTRYIVVLQSR